MLVKIANEYYIDDEAVLICHGYSSHSCQVQVREAKAEGRVINVTQGKKANSVIILKDYHMILTNLSVETVCKRVDEVKLQKVRCASDK